MSGVVVLDNLPHNRAMLRTSLLISFLLLCQTVFAVSSAPHKIDFKKHPEIRAHMQQMAKKYGFKTSDLNRWYQQSKIQPEVISKIEAPYESKPWYQYKQWFLKPDRIAAGVAFWKKYEKALKQAQAQYGVPAEIIVAIIGVETFYGHYTSPYRAMDALVTLAYEYPKRQRFFKSELENLLLLARDQHVSPLTFRSSYAGAIGLPQFMPSSYRNYAIDFDHNHHADLVKSPKDAIGSVANYLQHFGWEKQAPIAVPLKSHKHLKSKTLNPDYLHLELGKVIAQKEDLFIPAAFRDIPVGVLELDKKHGKEYWLGSNNLFVITRYNTSLLYAMAVFQLSQKLARAHQLAQRHLPKNSKHG